MRGGGTLSTLLQLCFFGWEDSYRLIWIFIRPFYFLVHPDLFGRHPAAQAQNEKSLQTLTNYVDTLVTERKRPNPKDVTFFIKPRTKEEKVRSNHCCYGIYKYRYHVYIFSIFGDGYIIFEVWWGIWCLIKGKIRWKGRTNEENFWSISLREGGTSLDI